MARTCQTPPGFRVTNAEGNNVFACGATRGETRRESDKPVTRACMRASTCALHRDRMNGGPGRAHGFRSLVERPGSWRSRPCVPTTAPQKLRDGKTVTVIGAPHATGLFAYRATGVTVAPLTVHRRASPAKCAAAAGRGRRLCQSARDPVA